MKQKTLKKAIYTALIASALSAGVCGVSFADQPIYAVEDGKQVASKTVYAFKPDSLYEVHCRVGYITDIKLKPGEAVSYSLVGDTSRWMFDQTTVGGVTHIYIKPMAEGIQTNLIVNSPTRSYRFVISEGPEEYSPIIEFTFEDEERKTMYSKPVELSPKQKLFNEIYTTNGEIEGRPILKKLNRRYEMKKHGKLDDDMLPTEVFDDGTRTYLKMPASNKYDLPTLYLVDEGNKLTLVNYRVRDAYFVADRVFSKARLKYSAKTYVDIIANEDKNSEDENKDYQIAERIQNAVREAYSDVKGEEYGNPNKVENKQDTVKTAQMAKALEAEKAKQEAAAAEIAKLKKQVEAEKRAKEKIAQDAAKAEAEWRVEIEKAKQKQLQEEAARKAAEAAQAQKAAEETRKAAEQAQTAAKQISSQTVAVTPVATPVATPAVKPVTEVKSAALQQKLVPDDQKKVFNEIFNTNEKLDGKKVLQALQVKQEIEKHGSVISTMLPKNSFILNGKTYFNMPKDYSGELPQIYSYSNDRLIPVNYEIKAMYLVVNGSIQKARLVYGDGDYADIILVPGGANS